MVIDLCWSLMFYCYWNMNSITFLVWYCAVDFFGYEPWNKLNFESHLLIKEILPSTSMHGSWRGMSESGFQLVCFTHKTTKSISQNSERCLVVVLTFETNLRHLKNLSSLNFVTWFSTPPINIKKSHVCLRLEACQRKNYQKPVPNANDQLSDVYNENNKRNWKPANNLWFGIKGTHS